MCKRINRFFPCLLTFYFAASLAISYFLSVTGYQMDFWLQCIVSQSLLLILAFVYIMVNKINIIKCIPYRKIKPLDALLSILFGYALVPLVLFINNLSMLFTTNHVEESATEFTTYPFLVQILLIAVIPPLVEEFVCRGLFYHSYRRNGILGAALVSGMVFGILHLNLNQFFYATIMGVAFALLIEATGSMFSAVLAHFAFNTYSITMTKLLSLFTSEDVVQESVQAAEEIPMASYVIALFVLAWVAIIFIIIAYIILQYMAKRNGRQEFLKRNLKKGLRAQNGEHFITVPYAITAGLAIIYMIISEIAMRMY